MNLAELKTQIVEKKFDNVYIFTGDEIKIMNIYIKQIANKQGREICRKDNVGEIFKTLKIRSLTQVQNVYVILDDQDFLKQEKYWEQLMTATDKHTIILVYSHLDKRGKFYKTYKDQICEFEKLNEKVLAKYITKEVELKPQQSEELALLCNNSYSRILMETDKITQLAQSFDISDEQAYKMMLKEDLIYTENSELTFKVADAICKRQLTEVFRLLTYLDVVKESPIAILSLIYANIKAMLLVAVCPPGAKVGETTGLSGFQIKLAYEKGNNYTPKELLNIMKVIKYTDEAIKIGKIEPQYALSYLVTEIM